MSYLWNFLILLYSSCDSSKRTGILRGTPLGIHANDVIMIVVLYYNNIDIDSNKFNDGSPSNFSRLLCTVY